MPEIKTEIVINAPKEKVWQALTDFENYPSWNPLIETIKGKLKEGSKIKVGFKAGSQTLFVPVPVKSYVPGTRFSWAVPKIALLNFFIDAEHYFEIESIDEKTSLFRHGEKFSGVFPRFTWKLIAKAEPYYEEMNLAFKRMVEKG